jgi:hypothetical protein
MRLSARATSSSRLELGGEDGKDVRSCQSLLRREESDQDRRGHVLHCWMRAGAATRKPRMSQSMPKDVTQELSPAFKVIACAIQGARKY